jgi:Transglutaminase-like superfamily
MVAWRAALPALKYLLPLPRLVRLMAAPRAVAARDPDRVETVVALAERVFPSVPDRPSDRCLERGLVAYRFLARANADPTLVIAVRKRAGLPRGHAWVTVDRLPVHDSPALLEDFASVMTFLSDGTLVREGGFGDAER